jgi:hypothetical protein
MWVIAGNDGNIKNDVWSSSDGITWIKKTEAASFSSRYMHACTVFDNELWIIGGLSNGTKKNDIWHSKDGIMWFMATNPSGFTARFGHLITVFNNELFLISGNDGKDKEDVWNLKK